MSRNKRNRRIAAAGGEPPPPPVEVPPTPPLELLRKVTPELLLAFASLSLALWPDRVGPRLREDLTFVCIVEIMFCLAQGTLTDIGTRLRKRPPWWAIPLIGGGLLLLYPETFNMLRGALAAGWAVFLPFLWSLIQRLFELWTMPGASRLEKMRRRALVGGRITLVLLFAGGAVATAAVTYLLQIDGGGVDLLGRTAGWWLAAAFTAAALDIVRVHRPSFARRPRALLPKWDVLGVDYLEPL